VFTILHFLMFLGIHVEEKKLWEKREQYTKGIHIMFLYGLFFLFFIAEPEILFMVTNKTWREIYTLLYWTIYNQTITRMKQVTEKYELRYILWWRSLNSQRSTNIYKMNNYLTPQVIEHTKRPRHMTLELQFQAWDMHQNVAGLHRLMGSQPPLDLPTTMYK